MSFALNPYKKGSHSFVDMTGSLPDILVIVWGTLGVVALLHHLQSIAL